MKKIMFNDRYGLTQAVLEGKKTMTRRNAEELNHPLVTDISEWCIDDKGKAHVMITYSTGVKEAVYPTYQPGEEIAIAQKYWDLRNCDAFYEALQKADPTFPLECIQDEKGCHNKMFVKAQWMPHRIRINNIKVERLQDISAGDIMREGIRQSVVEYGDKKIVQWTYFGEKITTWFDSPREAFAALIDRISGKGTWNSNPWVYAYEFELLR